MSDKFYVHQVLSAVPLPRKIAEKQSAQDFSLSLLRAVAGFTFAIYGSQLLFGLFGGSGPQAWFTLMWFAGVLEFLGGLLLVLGLFTRAVAFVLSGEMAFAFFLAHFPKGWNPVLNGGETSVLFCFIFLYLSTAGAGALSVDRLLQQPRQEESKD
jgi:putative oxidoreductase